MNCNLLLHCGAHAVERAALAAVPTPEPTPTWQPVSHVDLLFRVEESLPEFGLRIVQEAHALTHDGCRYFGLIEVQNGQPGDDYAWVLGLRNSHDRRLTAGIVAGSSVFVCDNLAFSGEIKVSRKHTRFVLRDLPELIDDALMRLVDQWHEQDRRIEEYKARPLTNRDANDLVIRALDAGAIHTTQIPSILREWRTPRHEAFAASNLWSWFNAVTEHLKGHLAMLPKRTETLYGVCDEFAGIR